MNQKGCNVTVTNVNLFLVLGCPDGEMWKVDSKELGCAAMDVFKLLSLTEFISYRKRFVIRKRISFIKGNARTKELQLVLIQSIDRDHEVMHPSVLLEEDDLHGCLISK